MAKFEEHFQVMPRSPRPKWKNSIVIWMALCALQQRQLVQVCLDLVEAMRCSLSAGAAFAHAQLKRAGTPGPKTIGIDEISIRKGGIPIASW